MDLDDDMEQTIKGWFRSILRYFAVPQHTYSTTGGIDLTSKLALGRECLVTDSSAYDPSDHEIGLSDKPAFITRMGIDLGDRGQVSLSYRIAGMASYGWAPAFYVAPTKSTLSVGGPPYTITCDMTTTLNTFTPSGTRPDHMYFDCLEYNASSGDPTADASYTAKGCSCGNYKVIAHRVDTRGHTNDEGYGVDTLEVSSVSADDDEIVLTDTSVGQTHHGSWDVSKGYVVFFAQYDDCEDCQKNKWIWFAGTNNALGAADDPGMRWQ